MNTICRLFPLAFAASTFAANTFFFNEAGYDQGKPISIVVQSTDNLEGSDWTLFYAPDGEITGATVTSGTFGKGEDPDKWAKTGKYYTIDLGSKLLPYSGKFYVSVSTGSPSTSGEFYIRENALAVSTLGMVMNYFFNDRATNAQIVSWDQKAPVYGKTGVTRDVHGGWYDASGDVSKYLSHLSYANYLSPQQIPLTVWSLAFAAEHIPALLASTKTATTAVEEAAYGADFLVRMFDEQGFFYMTVFDNWGMGSSRYLCAFSGEDGIKSSDYQTAFREGGGMAIAGLARVAALKANGDFTSEQYLATAEAAYAHLSAKQGIGQPCAYCDDGKENIIDDYTALLAATELYAATKNTSYLNDARTRAVNLANRLGDAGYFWSDDAKTRPFWHASDAGLPLIALIRYAEIENAESKNQWTCTTSLNGSTCMHPFLSTVNNAIKEHYNWLINITNSVENPFGYARQTYITGNKIKDGFFIPHDNESGYWWQGEDARIASLAAAVTYAAHALKINDTRDADKYATDQLDWILGKNPYGTSMMYGIGKKNPAKYDGQSKYDATLEGGIANGITGKNNDGSGIAWDDDGVSAVGFPYNEHWHNWRWIEQWLPHTTWFLNALVARYDEAPASIISDLTAIQPKAREYTKFTVQTQNRTIIVNAQGNTPVSVLQLDETKVVSTHLNKGKATFNLDKVQSGIYLVKVDGLGAKKIALK